MTINWSTPRSADHSTLEVESINMSCHLQSLKLELKMENPGKLLVRGPKELLSMKPGPTGPRGVAATSETSRSIGRGRSRAKIKVNSEVCLLYTNNDFPPR